jgi:hypothetical protein
MIPSIIQSNIKPAILIPILEDMIAIETLMQTEYRRQNDDISYLRSEMKITQLDMLLCLVRFKAAA